MLTPAELGPLAALAADQKAAVLLLTTSLAAPIAGYVFARAAGTWQPIENGQGTIERELPHLPRHLIALPQPVDPLVQEQEVRQMLEAKAERQRRRGESPIDVKTETSRLIAHRVEVAPGAGSQDSKLRQEVRALVIARNERRLRAGLDPLNIEAETNRQLRNSG